MSTFNKLNRNHEAMVNTTISCMLNPDNKDFYLGNMTLDKLASLIDYDSEVADCIFSALEIATPIYLGWREAVAQAERFSHECEAHKHICPHCGAQGYESFVKCPNCDFYEGDYIDYDPMTDGTEGW